MSMPARRPSHGLGGIGLSRTNFWGESMRKSTHQSLFGLARTVLVCSLTAFAAANAQAQAYPSRPIKFVLPYTPGGPVDFTARALERRMGELLGQPLVMDYRPGAGTAIGSTAVARSAPDGYTIMLGTTSSHSMNSAYNPKTPYDPVKDFTAIGGILNIPAAVVVNTKVPANSIKELIAYAKANPGKLVHGTAGLGNSQHFMIELFKKVAGVDMLNVPYQGQAGITQALMAGDVQVMFETANSEQSRDGRVRTLAVTSLRRSPFTPDLPAVSETIPGFEVVVWHGLFGPANLPKPIVDRLNSALRATIATPDVINLFAGQRAIPYSTTPEEFARHVDEEYKKWTRVAIESGIRLRD